MRQYRFTGETAEDFPDLLIGHTVQPGEVVELDRDPKHPRLEAVIDKKDAPKETAKPTVKDKENR
jgi:hypothetical protein